MTCSPAAKEVADVRSSLLDAKQSHVNGSSDLSHDHMANRDSYISFAGGFNNGVPEEDVPDLMGYIFFLHMYTYCV